VDFSSPIDFSVQGISGMNELLIAEEATASIVELDVSQMIASRVLSQLGRPKKLLRVEARHLWGDHFRVNVLIREDRGPVPTARIVDSFFVQLSDEGMVSQPPISRKY
jgi:hypothetical protein